MVMPQGDCAMCVDNGPGNLAVLYIEANSCSAATGLFPFLDGP